MSKIPNSIHSQTAEHEARGPHGEFLTSHPAPISSLQNSLNTPDFPSFLTRLWNKLSKLSLKKLTATAAVISLIATNSIFGNIVEYFFPNSSPLLHRSVAHQGTLKTSGNGQYSLLLPDNSTYTLYLKPVPGLSNLKNLKEVVVRGNLTFTPYVIENAEIYPVNISTP